jgi:hypothetical protein
LGPDNLDEEKTCSETNESAKVIEFGPSCYYYYNPPTFSKLDMKQNQLNKILELDQKKPYHKVTMTKIYITLLLLTKPLVWPDYLELLLV